MAEISREDAYDISENELAMLGESDDLAKFIRRAISDMEKLEKIEKIVNEYSFVEQYAYQTLDNIEQILKDS